MMGWGDPPIIGKNKDKTPFRYPLFPTSMMRRADCFPVSKRTENKPSYPYGGVDLNKWDKRNAG